MAEEIFEQDGTMGRAAIGATNRAVMGIILAEGLLIGVISWAFAAALAVPLSVALSHAVGMAFLRAPLRYTFSIAGVLIWLGLVIALAAVASFLPARNASRLTVRDILA